MTKELLTIWLIFATLFGAEFLFSPVYSFAEGPYIVFIILLWFLSFIFFYWLLENYFKATDETAAIFSVVSATIISFLAIIIFPAKAKVEFLFPSTEDECPLCCFFPEFFFRL